MATHALFPAIAHTLAETQDAIDAIQTSLHDLHRCIDRSRNTIEESREIRDRVTKQIAESALHCSRG